MIKSRKIVLALAAGILSISLCGCSKQLVEELLVEVVGVDRDNWDRETDETEPEGTTEKVTEKATEKITEKATEKAAETTTGETAEKIPETPKTTETPETTAPRTAKDTPAYVYYEGIYSPIISDVKVSSSAGSQYKGANVCDDDESTCWVSAKGDVTTASIEITFVKEFTISEIVLTNGPDQYNRVRAFTLTFDNGEEAAFEVKADDTYWSTEIVPVTTKWVKFQVKDIYGSTNKSQVALGDISFLYNANSYFAGLGVGDSPVMTKTESIIREAPAVSEKPAPTVDPGAASYVPHNWVWEPTGYSAQDIDAKYLRSGKWVSGDGNTVLYIDYISSPDIMDYWLYMDGKEYEHYGETSFFQENGLWVANSAYDYDNNILFSVPEAGKILLEKDGKSVMFTLEREKYSIYEPFY